MSTAGIPVLGSVTLSGATTIIRKERDYIIEHQIAGKDGGLVERIGSASTRFEIKGFLRESNADSQYQSLIGLLGTSQNLSIPTFGSGYFLAASGTIVFVESFGGNWIPGVGYPRYDYNLKLVSTNSIQPARTTPFSNVLLVIGQIASAQINANPQTVALTGVTAGNTLVIAYGARTPSGTDKHPTMTDSQSQTITTLASDFVQGGGPGSASCYGNVSRIVNALAGTHTITLSTTDSSQAGEVSIYELSGVAGVTAANKNGALVTSLAVAGIVQLVNQVCIGGCGSSVAGGIGASFTWSGAVQSLTGDGADANITGINGHFSGAISNNDFGVTRQGASTPNGMALAGVVFS